MMLPITGMSSLSLHDALPISNAVGKRHQYDRQKSSHSIRPFLHRYFYDVSKHEDTYSYQRWCCCIDRYCIDDGCKEEGSKKKKSRCKSHQARTPTLANTGSRLHIGRRRAGPCKSTENGRGSILI